MIIMDINLFLVYLLECNFEEHYPCYFKELQIKNNQGICKHNCSECVLNKIKELMHKEDK